MKLFNTLPRWYVQFIAHFTKTHTGYINLLHDTGFIGNNGEPLKCLNCGSVDFEDKVTDYINSTPCEKEVKCTNCESTVGYWAYGSYMN